MVGPPPPTIHSARQTAHTAVNKSHPGQEEGVKANGNTKSGTVCFSDQIRSR